MSLFIIDSRSGSVGICAAGTTCSCSLHLLHVVFSHLGPRSGSTCCTAGAARFHLEARRAIMSTLFHVAFHLDSRSGSACCAAGATCSCSLHLLHVAFSHLGPRSGSACCTAGAARFHLEPRRAIMSTLFHVAFHLDSRSGSVCCAAGAACSCSLHLLHVAFSLLEFGILIMCSSFISSSLSLSYIPHRRGFCCPLEREKKRKGKTTACNA